MQPGQRFEPGQANGDNNTNDDSLTPVDDQPADDKTPTPPPAEGSAQDATPPATPAQDITPPPAEPPASESEQTAPAAGAPSESAPTDTPADNQVDPTIEQSSDDQTRGDTTPPPAEPAQGGAGVSEPQDPSEAVAQPESESPTTPADEPTPLNPPPPDNPAEPSGGTEPPAPQPPTSPNEPDQPAQFSWEASEYVEHHHSLWWYAAVSLVALSFTALLTLVFKEILSGIVVVLMTAAIMVFAHRKPQSLRYQVNSRGVNIGSKFYAYDEFKSFAVLPAQSLVSIELDPVKRFMPRLAIILSTKEAEPVTNILGQYLPHEDRQPDFIDRLAHSLKF